ncbi:MAG: ABC transporter ATP-binding protein, partial [Caldilineaceae bacterium]|nr:ABC transporter ATP-binding protein [Caldilineaceae bacterium]
MSQSPPENFAVGLWRLLEGRRLLMGLSVLSGLLFAGTTLVPPLLIRRLIQWITEGGGSSGGLAGMIGLLTLVYLLRGILRYLYGQFSHVVAYGVMTDLMVQVYRHLQRLSHSFYNRQRTGALITRSINDIETLEDFLAHGVPDLVLAAVIPTTMLAVLYTLNPTLALIVLIPLPIGGWVIYKFTSRIRQSWRDVRRGITELVAQVQDSFSGISEIKAFGQEESQAERVQRHAFTYRDQIVAANRISLAPAGIVEFSGGLGVLLAVWFGGSFALDSQMSVADLFLFISYIGYIYQPFLKLADIGDTLHKATASLERVFELLAVEPEIVSRADAIAPSPMRWDVQFRRVSFAYRDEETVLQDIDFVIGEGQMVALVGPTGAGKTTISRLLPRFYDPDDGAVLVGGHDLRDLNLDFLRAHVAVVMQDVFLF